MSQLDDKYDGKADKVTTDCNSDAEELGHNEKNDENNEEFDAEREWNARPDVGTEDISDVDVDDPKLEDADEPVEKKARYLEAEVDAKDEKKGKGGRNFMFTKYFNSQAAAEEWCKTQDGVVWPTNPRIALWSMQVELCPTTKRVHVQGFVGLSKKTTMTFKSFQTNVVGRNVHVEKAFKVEQAFAYCQKEKTRVAGPWTHGEVGKAGARSDLKAFKEDCEKGVKESELQKAHYSIEARHGRYFEKMVYRHKCQNTRTEETECHIHWGDPGTGKTFQVKKWVEEELKLDWAKDVYSPVCENGSKCLWWDDYNGEKVCFIDEFAPWAFNFNTFKKMAANSTALAVQCKGGKVQFRSKYLVLTSNDNPRTWWKLDSDNNVAKAQAFRRRVKACKQYAYGPDGEGPNAWRDAVVTVDSLYG